MENKNIYGRIRGLVKKYEGEVIRIRQDLHMYPELSFQEFRTSKIVADILKELDIEVQTGIAKTGVVGILKGKNPGKTLGLRADMDALPIEEINDLSFKSINDGVMHACAHDCNTANLLGVAMILSELKDELNGTIKFIFQPAEEYGKKNSGGDLMVQEGVLENPKVDAVFASHLATFPVGIIGLTVGQATAHIDDFILKVRGKKAHSGGPHKGVDAMAITGNIITGLQTIISRQIDPTDAATFNLGTIHGGVGNHVVPDLIEITGMMRSRSKESRDIVKTSIGKIASAIAEGMGGECEFIFNAAYPPLINDAKLIEIIRETAYDRYDEIRSEVKFDLPPHVGLETLIAVREESGLGGEDFGWMSEKVPTAMFIAGSGVSAPPHNSAFIVNEKVFGITLDLMSSAAIKFLNE